MEVARCQGTNAAGAQCNAKALPGDRFCPWHSPAWADRRKAWSAKGGASRSNAARARRRLPDGALSAAELGGVLGVTLRGVLAGKIEPNVGNCVAALARAIRDVSGWAEIEERLNAIEEHDRRAPA